VADEREEVGGGPSVVPVAHAAAPELRMDGLGPRVGRCGRRPDPAQPVERTPVTLLELDKCELQREVGAQTGVGDALVEGVAETELANRVEGGDDRRIVRRHKPERYTGDQ